MSVSLHPEEKVKLSLCLLCVSRWTALVWPPVPELQRGASESQVMSKIRDQGVNVFMYWHGVSNGGSVHS